MSKLLNILWIVAMLAGTGVAAADEWRHLDAEDGLPSNEIQLIKPADRGTMWIGTFKGLVTVTDGKVSEPIIDQQTYSVLRDNGQLIVGTNQGVFRITDDQKKHELQQYLVTPIIQFDDDHLWALTRKGGFDARNSTVMQFADGQWQPIESLQGRSAVDVVRTHDGRVWVVFDGDGVGLFDPKQGDKEFKHLLEGLNVTTLFVDSQNRAWFGLWGSGVTMYDGQQFHDHLRKEEIYPFSIRENRGGTIWVATSQTGLFRYDGKKWENQLRDEGGVNLLETTSDGRVWISTQAVGGLRYHKDGKWVTVLKGPLPISCLTQGPDGAIWAGGVLDGLHVLPSKQ